MKDLKYKFFGENMKDSITIDGVKYIAKHKIPKEESDESFRSRCDSEREDKERARIAHYEKNRVW